MVKAWLTLPRSDVVEFLPLSLVLLAHALALSVLLLQDAKPIARVAPKVMEAVLLPAETASPVVSPPSPPTPAQPVVKQQPTPPVARPRPVALKAPKHETPAPPAPIAEAAPESAPVAAREESEPAPSAAPAPSRAAEPSAPEPTPPSADAARLGNKAPEYPSISRHLGEQGTVMLRLYITEDGSLGDVELKQSSGYRRLDDSAIEAVRSWKFIAARENGKAVAAWYLQPLVFSLH